MPIRFGNWNNAGNAGVAALNLNNVRGNVNTNIGFRLDFDHARRRLLTGRGPVQFHREAASRPKGQIAPKASMSE